MIHAVALFACRPEPLPVWSGEIRPIRPAARRILEESEWTGDGLLVLGEQHRSVVTTALVEAMVAEGGVDCAFLEWPAPRQRQLDRMISGAIRFDPQTSDDKGWHSPANAAMYDALRHAHTRVYAIDEEHPGLPPMFGRSVYQYPLPVMFEAIVTRNVEMADNLRGGWDAGQCRNGVALVGSGHLGSMFPDDPEGDLAALTAARGLPTWSLIVDDNTDATSRRVSVGPMERSGGREWVWVAAHAERPWSCAERPRDVRASDPVEHR